TEELPPGDTFLAEIVTAWEAAARPAAEAGVRVAYSRTGLVLSGHGGLAERMLPMVRRGLLGGLGDGTAYHAWITLDDVVRVLTHLIDSEVHGPVNVVAPTPITDRELFTALAQAFGKR